MKNKVKKFTDSYDFIEPALCGLREWHGLLYEWNQGDNVEDDIIKCLKAGFDIDDVREYLDQLES